MVTIDVGVDSNRCESINVNRLISFEARVTPMGCGTANIHGAVVSVSTRINRSIVVSDGGVNIRTAMTSDSSRVRLISSLHLL